MNTERISKIKEIVSQSMREDGWTPMSTIGLKLIAKGIDIKEDGFGKLKPFFESLSNHFVIGVDDFNRQEERSEYLYDLEKIAKTMYEYSQNSKVVKIELFMNGEIIGSLDVNH